MIEIGNCFHFGIRIEPDLEIGCQGSQMREGDSFSCTRRADDHDIRSACNGFCHADGGCPIDRGKFGPGWHVGKSL